MVLWPQQSNLREENGWGFQKLNCVLREWNLEPRPFLYHIQLYFTLLLYIFKNIFHKNSTNIHAPDQHNQFVMIYAIP